MLCRDMTSMPSSICPFFWCCYHGHHLDSVATLFKLTKAHETSTRRLDRHGYTGMTAWQMPCTKHMTCLQAFVIIIVVKRLAKRGDQAPSGRSYSSMYIMIRHHVSYILCDKVRHPSSRQSNQYDLLSISSSSLSVSHSWHLPVPCYPASAYPLPTERSRSALLEDCLLPGDTQRTHALQRLPIMLTVYSW